MTPEFIFIGMDDGPPRFTEEAVAEIAAGSVFSGGSRHRELVSHLLPEGAMWIDITVPLDSVFKKYEGHDRIVVFASGDPLFFGFAATVQRRMPDARLKILPAMNSLVLLAHRALLPYHNMRTVSLTGRPWDEFDRALIEGAYKIGILTDRIHTPAAIARRMIDYGYNQYVMIVGEHLGNRGRERVRNLTLEEAAAADFAAPNCVIVHGMSCRSPMGISDNRFSHLPERAGMITKMPVRLTTLSMLSLEKAACMWDIGFCTGSVSIETRLRFPSVLVHAFEIRPECERLIEKNARRLGAPGINVHIGDFLDPDLDLDALPPPNSVFIGGHGGRLEEVVARAVKYLKTSGSIVFNSVSEDSLRRFEAAIANESEMKLAARTRVAVDDHNPIEILKAIKCNLPTSSRAVKRKRLLSSFRLSHFKLADIWPKFFEPKS